MPIFHHDSKRIMICYQAEWKRMVQCERSWMGSSRPGRLLNCCQVEVYSIFKNWVNNRGCKLSHYGNTGTTAVVK